MKRLFITLVFSLYILSIKAQDDQYNSRDTIIVGNMIIIRSGKDRNITHFDSTEKVFRSKKKNVVTNWAVIDLGFNQINHKTNYANAMADGYLPIGASDDWFNQRDFKSTNVNIWVFMQNRNLIKHVVNLKYGIGIELNNYKYKTDIKYQATARPMVIMDDISYSKNKLAADYLTVPLMLNFNFSPDKKEKGFGFSAGVSAGFLYSSRQKTNGGPEGKHKFRDDFELRKFKVSYIAELSLGHVRLYGSYATKSMFKNGLDQIPYSFGIRISQH